MSKVAIFWDYENCSLPASSSGLGFDIVNNIARIARVFGSITSFRAYLDVSAQSSKSVSLRSELQSSGLSIIDCPHNGKKDVVDKMILVDMLVFAVDHPSPATIFLITGDRDYAYAVSTLKLRKYQIILVVPSSPHTSPSLESQASLVLDWSAAVLRSRTEQSNSTHVLRQPYFDIDPTLVTKLLRELREPPLDDPDATLHSFASLPQGHSGMRRVTARDLLDSSRHSKNTESFDSTHDFIRNTPSPTKYATSLCESAHGGLTIPKTPSRSRHASVSTVSTRPRSMTIVSQSPPVIERRTPAKNLPPSTARRPITSDPTDAVILDKRSPSVLTSLDPLGWPLDDDRPPSSIIVRSPLDLGQSTCDMPRLHTIPSFHILNCLASPFVTTEPPTGLQSVSDQQSRTTVAPTKTFVETVTSVRGTPQLKEIDIGVPKEIERLTGLRVENEGNFEQSIPHRVLRSEGPRDAPDLATSNHHCCVAPHLSNRNVGLHLTDDSLPAAGFLGLGDGGNSAQFTATRDRSALGTVSASGAFSSVPSTADSHEHDESERCQTWTMFKPLIHLLLAVQQRGIVRPPRSIIAVGLVKSDSRVYRRAGVSSFKDYTALAEQAGIIELGGKEADAWIGLHPNWFGVDGMTTGHLPSNRASPTFDPPKETPGQDPSLTASEMIGRAASFQTPGPRSLESPTHRSQHNADYIPAEFQPLVDTLVRMRVEGSHQPRRSLVGQMLEPVVYSQAGVSGFKQYIHRASEAQLVEFGGVGGLAWIRLHPDLCTIISP